MQRERPESPKVKVSSVEKSHEQKEKESENEMEMDMKVRSWTRRHSQQSSKGEIGG
jgi:hypothetical protein